MWNCIFWLSLAAAAVLLSACADPIAALDNELDAFRGKNINALSDRLGYPASQDFAKGKIVYTWNTSRRALSDSDVEQVSVESMTTGRYFTPSNTPETTNQIYYCSLEVTTDGASTITNLHWSGDRDGCRVYASALR
jgi:hypothetical protein